MARKMSFLVVMVLALAACKPKPTAPTEAAQAEAQKAAPVHEGHVMQVPATLAAWADGARLFDGLGDFHRQASTQSTQAQQYFDQGMRFLWAFNHDESTRSFAKAAQLDPKCAICYWGVALTVGPNYNLPMMAESRAKVASEAVALAKENSGSASAVEKALIGALEKRYPNAQPLDPTNAAPVMTAYADAMRNVAKEFRDDLDVQTLFAESMMNLNAWKLWGLDGKPAAGTPEIQATLERVLAKNPQHPGANHYYMHTMEASPQPHKALAAAERVTGMMPAAGHLEHMPAHIMQRVGRYEDAAEANRKGAAADEQYLKQATPPDYYGMYVGHNYQFLAYSAAMEGRKAETLEAVRNSRRAVPDAMLLMMPGLDWYLAHEYAALVRFGLWDEMLARPAPDARFPGLTGGYLYGKGMALAAKGQLEDAKRALSELDAFIAKTPTDAPAAYNTVADVLNLARELVQARIAAAESRTEESIKLLRDATAREDKLAYDEPKDWFFPVRHLLGAQLLTAGQTKAAETVYREDLKQHPGNGWSLYGLAAALRAQKKAEASKIDQQFREAWKHADIELTASAF